MQEKELGWRLLRDEHELLDYRGYQMAIIGVEYWGHSMRFGKKGNVKKPILEQKKQIYIYYLAMIHHIGTKKL